MGLGLMALEAWAQACGLRLMGLRLVEMGPISGSSSWVFGLDGCMLSFIIIVINYCYHCYYYYYY